VFGVPPEVSLGVSLVRRGRDLVVGVPILLVWQLIEMRHLRKVAAEESARNAAGGVMVPAARPDV
jgi:hypothetical protein